MSIARTIMITMSVDDLQSMIQSAVQLAIKEEFAPLRRQFEERLISIEEAAKILNVTKQTLYNWEKAEKLQPVRLSDRKVMYRESDITQYLNK